MKIKVLTFFNNSNIGSELQAYSMQHFLKENGYSNIKFIKRGFSTKVLKGIDLVRKKFANIFLAKDMKNLMCEKNIYSKSHEAISFETKMSINSFSKQMLETEFCDFLSMKKDKDSIYICGSDQIWSPFITPISKENFLAYIPSNRKIAYAPSFGINNIPESFKKRIKSYLQDFKFIGMREARAAEVVKNLTNKNVPVLCDPVFLVQSNFWYELEQKSKLFIEEDYVFCYFLDEPNLKTKEFVENISKGKNIKYICYKSYFEEFKNAKFIDVGPSEFLSLIKNAKCIITDSFHATAFSLIFEKDVRVFSRNHPKALQQNGRILDLFNTLSIERTVDCYDEQIKPIEYNNVTTKKEEFSLKSREFLLDSLKKVSSN